MLYSQSVDGRTWTAPTVLFEPPGPVTHWHGEGLVHTAATAVVIHETLYAVTLLHENIGFTDFDRRLRPVPERDKEHPARARKGYSPVARAVGAEGTVLLIGNQCAPEFDNTEQVQHYDRLPLTVSVSQDGRHFAHVRTIRTGRHDWSVPQSEVGGRGQGYQYPNACIVGDRLLVIHSIGKERIAVSSVAMSEVV